MAQCLDPIFAVSIMKNDKDKHVLKFVPASEIENIEDKKRVYGIDEVFILPCMRCKPCRENYAKDWAVRCTLEAQLHKYNYFLTLTYDQYHILYGGKHDFTAFLKKLGYKLTGEPVRPLFFACEELGEITQRLHYHCVLFLDQELKLKNPVKIGTFYHYSCDLLDECWNKGFVDVAPFESDCARYVAKYSTKTGSCFMSRNLAKSYYLKYRDQIVKDKFKVYGQFGKRNYVDIPKCFVRWFIEDQIDDVSKWKMDKKDLQRLLMLNSIHLKVKKNEASLIREKIYSVIKADQKKKGRVSV